MPRLAPMLLDIGMGIGVGVVRNMDHQQAATRTTLTKQIGTWVEGGAAAIGLVGEMGRFLPGSISDPLLSHGLAFFTERLTRSQLSGKLGNPYPMSVAGNSRMGVAAYPASIPAYATKQFSPTVI